MLQTISIRNFKSLQEVNLELKDVNLLIGANNSGKTNLLKALVFFGNWLQDQTITEDDFIKLCFQQKKPQGSEEVVTQAMGFYFMAHNIEEDDAEEDKHTLPDFTYVYGVELYGFEQGQLSYTQFFGYAEKKIALGFNLNDLNYLFENFQYFSYQANRHQHFNTVPHDYQISTLGRSSISFIKEPTNLELKEMDFSSRKELLVFNVRQEGDLADKLLKMFDKLAIYQPDPTKLSKPYPTLEKDYLLKPNVENLVSFLDNMRDELPEVIKAITDDLKLCVQEFSDLRFQKIALSEQSEERKQFGDKTFKRFGLYDEALQSTFWSDEISEGTLYFLGLLAIIHQPHPPKLLLLEEPEKGIHPRRIKEVLDFIFQLSNQKNIQVIMTSHSPEVLNYFDEFSENVFVFDKNKNRTTEIKNLYKDIIIPKEQSAQEKGVNIDLNSDLGTRWKIGFYGGVPHNNPIR